MIKFRSLALALLMALSLATGSTVFAPTIVHAQVDTGLTAVGGTVALSATDPRIIAARIINAALGLLGIIMVVLILYAGFLWMTSGGEAEKVEKAKLYIRNAIIGIVIILTSWAITTFVINALISATGGGGGGGAGSGGSGTPPGSLPGSPTASFSVDRITPAGTSTIRNLEINFILTREIDATTANANLRVLRVSDSAPVSGTIVVSGRVATFTPSASCPAPNETRKCFDANMPFRAEIASGLRSTTGLSIVCGGFSPACQMEFATGNVIDTAPPTSAITWPTNGMGVEVGASVPVALHATDDAGVTRINAFAGGVEFGIGTGPASSTSRDISPIVNWSTAGVALGSMSLRATAHDVDSNTTESPIVSVVVRPTHCFNHVLDAAEGETGIDCDAKIDATSCGACTAGACTSGASCASGVCSAGVCVEQPMITSISPPDGRPGTLVTISGVNFGDTAGEIKFAGGIIATAPAACVAAGIPTWSRSQVVVAVPVGAVTGPVTLKNSAGLSDVSSGDPASGDRGPQLPDFTVNDVARPGLCGANPDNGLVGGALELVGTGLGTVSDRVYFNNGESDREISSFTGWVDDRISLSTPVIAPTTYAVRARSAGAFSNSVSYRINTPVVTSAPEIISLSPVDGPMGEYVTIVGRNFGTSVGFVNFRKSATEIAVADTDFPAGCARAFWSDTSITIKVPRTIHVTGGLATTDAAITPGAYQIEVVRGTVHSNTSPFTITTATPRPGICAILPTAGPVGTSVSIIGERFGSDSVINFAGPGGVRVPAAILPAGRTIANLNTNVPATAVTGRVDVSAGTQVSDGLNFAVRNCNEDVSICAAAGEICCRSGACSTAGGVCAASSPTAMFAWHLSTSILPVNPSVIEECSGDPSKLPSPSPWGTRTGGDAVCVNADIYLRFNTHLKASTVSTGGATASLIVRRCTAGGATPCTATEPVAMAPGYPLVGTNGPEGFIRYRSQDNLLPSATYQVLLTTAIHSDPSDNAMLPRAECGAGNAYCFTFTTRPSTELCKVNSVNVVPSPYTMNDIGIMKDYNAVARAVDSCVVLRGDGYNWSWNTSNAGLATVSNDLRTTAPGIGLVSENQVVTSRMETGVTPVRVNASMVDGGLSVNGSGDLFISLVQPKVDAYGPNCDKACMNGVIWARFNVPMRPSTLSNSNIIIKPCRTENCRTFDPPLDLSTSLPATLSATNTKLTISPTRSVGGVPELLLQRGRFYRVIIKGGSGIGSIRSNSGLALTGLNDPEGFAWNFRVKDDADARCLPESINMSPAEKIESAVGQRQEFVATPVSGPTACNAEGEPLVADRPFAWSINQTPTVSKYVNGSGDGLVDTNPIIGPGCNDRCTPRGADGLFGKTASCGNGMIETSDTNYCRNGFPGTGPCAVGASGCRTIHDDACQILAAGSHGSEECEGTSATGCGPTCLWNPVPVAVPPIASPVCGNGRLDRGEQCDPGATGTPGCSNVCQFLGSQASGSVCGNGAIGDGEACDDGNTVSGDGCSADCLHEGSSVVISLCGNGIIEPGETCDTSATWCDHATCLRTGTTACTTATRTLCCGNGVIDAGEDCDGGDGCSNRCLAQGSSTQYRRPSFCGDGITGQGEVFSCEAGVAGNGRMDALQLAEIVGNNTLVPADNGRMISTVRASYEGKTGDATYGLQCGFTAESSCSAYPGTGLDDNGCCAPRPTIVDKYPPSDSTPAGLGICRNALITAKFNEQMQDASMSANFVVGERIGSMGTCPAGSTSMVIPEDTTGMPWWKKAWVNVLSFFHVDSAYAQVYCVGTVRGRLMIDSSSTSSGSIATFTLERALKPLTQYRVTFQGDASLLDNPAGRQGIRTARGVVSNGPIQWTFRTGERICTVSSVDVRDLDVDHPGLYVKPSETHAYAATPISLQDGLAVPISTVAEYRWTWDGWSSSMNTIVNVVDTLDSPNTIGTSLNQNGTSYISTGIQIAHDEITVPSTTNQLIRGSTLASVFLCENPWPASGLAPFSDRQDSVSIPSIFADGPFYNFSTMYCRDKNAAGTADDLPSMNVVGVAPSAIDTSLGVQRQYLFTYTEPELAGDGIGIRVVINPLHQSPSAWYAAKGFSGSPKVITVDGYEALQDGNTVYIGAVNTDGTASGEINPMIYVLSRNPDAQQETVDIFDQMVKNLVLNVNLQDDSQNICLYAVGSADHAAGSTFRGADGRSVSCTADWECLNRNSDLRCASFKTKMQRDIKRIADFQRMTSSLESAKTRDGKYPELQTGSFLQTMSNSRWPSWQGAFTAELGTTPPVDPVNRFLSCGVCSGNSAPCMDASDCRAGETCKNRDGVAYAGIETSTCWNPTSRQFMCPKLNPANPYSVSRFYQYRALSAGARYELSTELEGPSPSRYRPALLSEIKRCTNVESVCLSDGDCTVPGSDPAHPRSTGSCVATGGSWKYVDSCNETAYRSDTICGNGVRGPAEVCEIGDTRPGVCGTATIRVGTRLQVCNSTCTGFVDAPVGECVDNRLCGNGRIDRMQCLGGAGGYRYGQACSTIGSISECIDPRDTPLRPGETAMRCQEFSSPERCDDGALNGTYGRCNRTCTGYNAYCGDGLMSPGEACDKGIINGNYNTGAASPANTCNESCSGPAPYCGDGAITSPQEACDGNTQISNKKLCNNTAPSANIREPCDTDADCGGAAGTCGGTEPIFQACSGTLGLCSSTGERCGAGFAACTGGECIQYPTQRRRSCASVTTPVTLACQFNAWSACEPIGSCGNGSVDPGEECDDGNRNENDACTNVCKRNICGDTHVNVGTEECDNGALNGTNSCTADYGSTCVSCSTTCRQVSSSGGFCGNGIKEGPEQCDRTDLGSSVPSCRALGYDYAKTYSCRAGIGSMAFNIPAEDRATTPACSAAGAVVTENVSCDSSCGFSGCRRCSDTPGDGHISGQVFDAVNYLFPVPNARVTLYSRGSRVGETFTSTSGTFAFNTINRNSECAQYRIVVDYYLDNPCTGDTNVTLAPGADATTCNGKRWPAGWGSANEGVNGGYWPYNSDVFGLGSFRTDGIRNSDGKIFLMPRVGPDETLVVTSFSGDHKYSSYLVVPKANAFTQMAAPVGTALENIPYASCTLEGASAPRGGVLGRCMRSLYFGVQGNVNLDVAPNAFMRCQKEAGGALSGSCYDGSPSPPQVMKFKRGSWSRDGWYSYFIVDLVSHTGPTAYEEFRNSLIEARIVTDTANYKVRLPEVAASSICSPAPAGSIPPDQGPAEACGTVNPFTFAGEAVNGRGKYWLAFQQNANTGQIVIPPNESQLLCRGSQIPNEPSPEYSSLPWPLMFSDCKYSFPF